MLLWKQNVDEAVKSGSYFLTWQPCASGQYTRRGDAIIFWSDLPKFYCTDRSLFSSLYVLIKISTLYWSDRARHYYIAPWPFIQHDEPSHAFRINYVPIHPMGRLYARGLWRDHGCMLLPGHESVAAPEQKSLRGMTWAATQKCHAEMSRFAWHFWVASLAKGLGQDLETISCLSTVSLSAVNALI